MKRPAGTTQRDDLLHPVGQFCIAADHPSLPGHFPGNPVVPGVVLLDAAFTLILVGHPGCTVTEASTLRFTRPVRAGQAVEVSCGSGATRIAFACAVDGQSVLQGMVTLGTREALQ